MKRSAKIVFVLRLVVAIIIHIVLLWKLSYIAWPENFAWPYFNLHGLEYYKNIFVLYPPLYWLSLTGFYKLFGLSLLSLKAFNYLVVIVSDYLLWLAADKKLKVVGYYTPMQIFFEGTGIWVDQFLVPFFLLAYIFFKRNRFFWTGIFLGSSLLVKQTAVYIVPIFALAFLTHKTHKDYLAHFIKTAIGLVVPIVFLLIYLLFANALQPFLVDSIHYILIFHSRYPLQTQWPTTRQALITGFLFIPAILIGLKNKHFLLTLLTVTAALGIFTRFEYFHLQPALPFLAMLWTSTSYGYILFPMFLFILVRFFIANFNGGTRFLTTDILRNASVINRYVKPGTKTLFIDTWDHYYYLTQTLPVRDFFVPSAPWSLDYPGNQERILQNLKQHQPEYVVYNDCFFVKNICYRPKLLNKYFRDNYLEIIKLPDGTGVFEYNPVGGVQKIQAPK